MKKKNFCRILVGFGKPIYVCWAIDERLCSFFNETENFQYYCDHLRQNDTVLDGCSNRKARDDVKKHVFGDKK